MTSVKATISPKLSLARQFKPFKVDKKRGRNRKNAATKLLTKIENYAIANVSEPWTESETLIVSAWPTSFV